MARTLSTADIDDEELAEIRGDAAWYRRVKTAQDELQRAATERDTLATQRDRLLINLEAVRAQLTRQQDELARVRVQLEAASKTQRPPLPQFIAPAGYVIQYLPVLVPAQKPQ
jgi:hypothetical protein